MNVILIFKETSLEVTHNAQFNKELLVYKPMMQVLIKQSIVKMKQCKKLNIIQNIHYYLVLNQILHY